MKKLLLSLLCAGAFAALSQKPAVVASDKTGWHKIGETTVDFEKDQDEVAVLAADRFAMLKFKVTDAPIELIDVDVYFEEGDKQNIRIGSAVKPDGSESSPIDLKGGAERDLKKIAFHYRTVEKNSAKKAHVEIWGKKTNAAKTSKNGNDGKMKSAAKETSQDVKDAGKEAKKDAKKAGKEVKKEAKEAKKEAKETKHEVESDIKDN